MDRWRGVVVCFLMLQRYYCVQGKTKSVNRPLRWVVKSEALQYLTVGMSDIDQFRKKELIPMLKERISGTPGNVQVKEHIVKQLGNLGWLVEEDSFEDNTPFGRKNFTNVIATHDPSRLQRVIFACHFDSKDMRTEHNQEFIGATDSAVPCAILLETAKQLDCLLKKGPRDKSTGQNLTLQFVFFDGEEAYRYWTETDSLYGSRHLAEKWERESKLASIRELCLLDLIGTTDTQFVNYFESTSTLYEHLMKVEKYLRSNNLLSPKQVNTIFNQAAFRNGGVEDDHIPFLRKGVDILHLISSPFPSVWHRPEDNGDSLDYDLIDNFSRIFRVFISNLLHLSPEYVGCRKK